MAIVKDILHRVRYRNVKKLSMLINYTAIYHGQTIGKRLKIIDWIGKNTSGRFFISDKKVYFEKEIDATIFKLGFKL